MHDNSPKIHVGYWYLFWHMIIASFNAHKFYIDKQCLAIMLMKHWRQQPNVIISFKFITFTILNDDNFRKYDELRWTISNTRVYRLSLIIKKKLPEKINSCDITYPLIMIRSEAIKFHRTQSFIKLISMSPSHTLLPRAFFHQTQYFYSIRR